MKSLLVLATCILALTLPAWGEEAVASEAEAPSPQAELTVKLKRLVVGNQGAILKIWKVEGGGEPDYYRGLDDRDTAPYSPDDQEALVTSLGMSKSELEQTALTIMEEYDKLPKKNALAFLGLVVSIGEDSPYDAEDSVDSKIQEFLLLRLKEDKSVIMRRQACLSLAVGSEADQEIIESILGFYSQSENLWETFPVQQFFQYHAKTISTLPNFPEIRDRVAGVNSLYTANILSYLDEAHQVSKAQAKPSGADS